MNQRTMGVHCPDCASPSQSSSTIGYLNLGTSTATCTKCIRHSIGVMLALLLAAVLFGGVVGFALWGLAVSFAAACCCVAFSLLWRWLVLHRSALRWLRVCLFLLWLCFAAFCRAVALACLASVCVGLLCFGSAFAGFCSGCAFVLALVGVGLLCFGCLALLCLCWVCCCLGSLCFCLAVLWCC